MARMRIFLLGAAVNTGGPEDSCNPGSMMVGKQVVFPQTEEWHLINVELRTRAGRRRGEGSGKF